MTNPKPEAQPNSRRQLAERAIRLALESHWEDAVRANSVIVARYPTDTEAHNRLGKALMELGRYRQAQEAYRRTLDLDPSNTIAQKNLTRLESLVEAGPAKVEVQRSLPPEFFIAETAKTGVFLVHNPNQEALSRVTAGEQVELRPEGNQIQVLTLDGEALGEVEPKMALRLARLIEGGNRYVAAVAATGEEGTRILIRETFQHPSQAGKVSFPSAAAEGVRAYIKESILRHEVPGEHLEGELEAEEWEGEGVPGTGIATLGYGVPTALGLEEAEAEEEEAETEEEEEF